MTEVEEIKEVIPNAAVLYNGYANNDENASPCETQRLALLRSFTFFASVISFASCNPGYTD